jgi:hypothetical protein
MATRRPLGPGEGPGPRIRPTPQPKTAEAPPAIPAAEPEAPQPARESPLFPAIARGDERRDRQKQDSQDRLMGEGRIGDESVTAKELAEMGSLVAARHLMVLLAKGRGKKPRAEVLGHVGELLIALDRPEVVRRLLLELPDAGRIIDIYPLEVLDYVLARRADLLPGFEYGAIVLNKSELEASTFRVEEPIAVRVPLSLKMRAFALDGGGTPGYCFSPGPPGEYHLEVGDAGRFSLLLRGDVRKISLVDRLIVEVTDPPD